MLLPFQAPTSDGPEGQLERIRALEKYVSYLNGFIDGFVENVEKEVASLRQRISFLETPFMENAQDDPQADL